MAGDKYSCSIQGMCGLATGEFHIADQKNMEIKLLDNNYKVISTCDVPENFQDVCLIGDREAAVSVNKNIEDRHEIHLFRVRSGTLQKTRSVKLRHECVGLAHNSGNLYVTTGTQTSLYVYNILSGQGRQLYSHKTRKNIYVDRCAVGPGGSRAYTTNFSNDQLRIFLTGAEGWGLGCKCFSNNPVFRLFMKSL